MAICGGVELKIKGPQHVRSNGTHPSHVGAHTYQALPGSSLRYPKSLLAPQASHSFVVDVPASSTSRLGTTAPSPSGALSRELDEKASQTLFLVADHRGTKALGGAM